MKIPSKDWSAKDWLDGIKLGGKLHQVPEEYRTLEVCIEAMKQDHWGYSLEEVPEQIYAQDLFMEWVEKALKKNGSLLQFIPEAVKTPKICAMAFNGSGWVLLSIPKEFLDKGKLLTDQELLKKYTREELLTSSNAYLRKLGASNED